MNVLATPEGVQQPGVLGHVSQHPQLDLRVVGGKELPVGGAVGNEGPPDLPPCLGAYGNVLKVGIAAGDTAGGRARLVVAGMHPASARIDHVGQGVDVGRLELGHLSVLEDLVYHGVDAAQRLQSVGVGGIMASLGAPGVRQPQFLEQQVTELGRRVEVYLVSYGGIDPRLDLSHLPEHVSRHLMQHTRVQLDAVPLHPHQHRQQGYFRVVHQATQFLPLQLRLEHLPQTDSDIRVGGGVVGGGGDVHLVEGDLLAPLANQVGDGRHFVAQLVERQVFEAQLVVALAQQVSGDHAVEVDVLESNSVVGQHGHVVVGVVGALGDAGRLEQRTDGGQHRLQGYLFALAVAHRHVPGPPGRGGETESHQVRTHCVEVGGLRIEGKGAGLLNGSDHRFQLSGVLHHRVVGGHLLSSGISLRQVGAVGAGNPGHHAVELKLGEKRNHVTAVVVPETALLEVQQDWRLPVDGHESTVLEGALAILLQCGLDAGRLDSSQVLVDALQATVFSQQGRRPFLAHPGDARDIVR